MPLPTALEVLSKSDLTSKTAIITGAGGLGFETIRALAHKGCHVVVGARSLTVAQKAASDIKAEGAKGPITVEQLDLANIESVRSFALRISKSNNHVDYLVRFCVLKQ